jgi:transposase InsO family protein
VYRKPAEVAAEDLAIMALIDRHDLARPSYGSRRMAVRLATKGYHVNRKRVQRLRVSRAVLARRLSNTLAADFCVEALEEALSHHADRKSSIPIKAARSPVTILPAP